jgi:predicted anti-sigma-YlaC factor YlaD
MDISGKECARARESVSADLDSELQELDLRRLQAHLRVCADCSAWAEVVRATAIQLREAPLEAPRAFAFEPRRRSRTWRAIPALAFAPVAALVASVVVALGGAQHGSLGQRATTRTPLRPADRSFVRTGIPGPVEQHRVFRAI